ncbi:MAG: hypothetical protein CVV33_08615 [Methanomicrobiales archaeon HGW-Methanomicrobiales-4]|nr:MAG: hypothetical protein CVV33_08615 [Methanomicrobiales archaeon HGW-Methanomicrobiales-4]
MTGIEELSMDFYQNGDFTRAAELFHQIVQADKTNHKAWNAYGICLTKHGEYDVAAGCYENAIRLDQGNRKYQKNFEINEKKRDQEK